MVRFLAIASVVGPFLAAGGITAQKDAIMAPNAILAFEQRLADGEGALGVIDADGRNYVALVTGGSNMNPAWSPDGQWIAFSRSDMATPGIYMVQPDGTGLCRIVATTGLEVFGAPAWSPMAGASGYHTLVYVDRQVGQPATDLFAVSARCNATDRRPLTTTPELRESWPAWSVQNRLAASVSQGRQSDVYVFTIVSDQRGVVGLAAPLNLTAGGPIANQNAYGASWAADGRELLVSAGSGGDLWMMSATTPAAAARLTTSARDMARRPTWSPGFSAIAYDSLNLIKIHAIARPWQLGEPKIIEMKKSIGHLSWRPQPRLAGMSAIPWLSPPHRRAR